MAIKKPLHDLKVTGITKAIFGLLGFYALSIILFDSGNLITRDAVIQRWTIGFILLIINTVVWFLASPQPTSKTGRLTLTLALSLALIVFAGFMTYWERGMASTSTILYVFPMLVAALLRKKRAVLAIASLSAGTYTFAAVKYFNYFFNEGYRVQLWGNVALYAGLIFAAAWAINTLIEKE